MGASLTPQTISNPPAMARVRSLGQEYPQQKGMATHTSILAWRIAWTEEPSGLQSMGPHRVGHSVLFCFFPLFSVQMLHLNLGPRWEKSSPGPAEILGNLCFRQSLLHHRLWGWHWVTLLPLGQVGQSRSLPVSWRTEEAPLLWGHWHFLAPCADTQEWGCKLFIAFGHRTSGHLNLSVSSCARTHF